MLPIPEDIPHWQRRILCVASCTLKRIADLLRFMQAENNLLQAINVESGMSLETSLVTTIQEGERLRQSDYSLAHSLDCRVRLSKVNQYTDHPKRVPHHLEHYLLTRDQRVQSDAHEQYPGHYL